MAVQTQKFPKYLRASETDGKEFSVSVSEDKSDAMEVTARINSDQENGMELEPRAKSSDSADDADEQKGEEDSGSGQLVHSTDCEVTTLFVTADNLILVQVTASPMLIVRLSVCSDMRRDRRWTKWTVL